MSKILIVDDDPDVRAMLHAVLLAEGHEVVDAEDGPSALAKAAESNVDLIMLDVMMPGMDGYEVLRRLKADAATEAIPVVMVTARDDNKGLLVERAGGAVAHLGKPFRIEDLEHAIERAMHSPTGDEELRRDLGRKGAQAHLDAASMFDSDEA